MMKKCLKQLSFTILTGLAATSYAAMDNIAMKHDHAAMDHSQSDAMSSDMFLEKKEIDGFTVSFHVMKANAGMNHGGSQNLMIKVEKAGKALGDIKANSKVVYPDGQESSKMLMKMGDWYMNGYDMEKPGKYQLMVLFKTSDGQKHFGGVHYTVK